MKTVSVKKEPQTFSFQVKFQYSTENYSEASQTFKMKLFAKTVDGCVREVFFQKALF